MHYSDDRYRLRVQIDAKQCEIAKDELARMEGMLTPLGEAVQDFTGSDLERIRRQQKFMASVVNKSLSAGTLTNPIRTYKLLSAVTKMPVHRDMAMTGEITLRGKVLPVGGVKDKILAAARAGLTKVILPAENERDLDDIPADVREKMEFHLVESMDEVVTLALDGTIVPLAPKEKLTEPVEPPLTH